MNALRRPALTDNRAVLAGIQSRLVRAVLREEGVYSDALIAVLLERRYGWSLEAWDAELEDLATSHLTVSELLSREHARTA